MACTHTADMYVSYSWSAPRKRGSRADARFASRRTESRRCRSSRRVYSAVMLVNTNRSIVRIHVTFVLHVGSDPQKSARVPEGCEVSGTGQAPLVAAALDSDRLWHHS